MSPRSRLATRWLTMTALAAVLALAVTGWAVGPASIGARPASERLTGQLLVATEDLRDPRFSHTVVYMISHDADGAMGLVVNRPLGDVPRSRLLELFGSPGRGASGSVRVFYGGPVGAGLAFVLHTTDWTSAESRVLGGGIALTAHPSILDALAHGRGPRRSLLALGYAGWAPGQLEDEIQRGFWISVPADEALVFEEDADAKWERAMARRRISI